MFFVDTAFQQIQTKYTTNFSFIHLCSLSLYITLLIQKYKKKISVKKIFFLFLLLFSLTTLSFLRRTLRTTMNSLTTSPSDPMYILTHGPDGILTPGDEPNEIQMDENHYNYITKYRKYIAGENIHG